MNKSRGVKARFAPLLCALFLLPPGAPAASPRPDALEVLRTVRAAQAAQHQTLRGQLSCADHIVPFTFTMEGASIRYQFGNPPETLLLRLDETRSQLDSVSEKGKRKSAVARFDQPVADTDLRYEDLALSFLYWPNAKIVDEQTRLFRSCWVIQTQPASPKDSSYSKAELWIEKESGALLQAEAYAHDGSLAKRFKVTEGQKINGAWFLKLMRIESTSLDSKKDRTPTYLEVLGVDPDNSKP